MKKTIFIYGAILASLSMPAKAIEELSEIEVVGTSLLPGLEIEEEKLLMKFDHSVRKTLETKPHWELLMF